MRIKEQRIFYLIAGLIFSLIALKIIFIINVKRKIVHIVEKNKLTSAEYFFDHNKYLDFSFVIRGKLFSPLGYACYLEHYEMAHYLAIAGAKIIKIKGKRMDTSSIEDEACKDLFSKRKKLELLVSSGNLKIIKKVLKLFPGKITLKDLAMESLLKNKSVLFKKLLEEFPYSFSSEDLRFFLWTAVEKNTPSVLKILLDSGVNPNFGVLPYKTTPLIEAVKKGYTKIVSLLIDSGADPNTILDYGNYGYGYNMKKDKYYIHGRTPLYFAIQKCNPVMINLLISKGGRIDMDYEYGKSLLYLAEKSCKEGYRLMRKIQRKPLHPQDTPKK